MTIREYFGDTQDISYNEIIGFVEHQYLDGDLPFLLRELTTDNRWQVEAYFSHTMQGVRMSVIFAEEVLSPYKNYNQAQVETIISDVHDKCRNAMKILATI